MTVVGAAPGDEDLSAFQAVMLELIRGQVGHVLRYIDEQGWMRADVPFDELVRGVLCDHQRRELRALRRAGRPRT